MNRKKLFRPAKLTFARDEPQRAKNEAKVTSVRRTTAVAYMIIQVVFMPHSFDNTRFVMF
ncbi:hypothetical protein BLOT_002586 [Blomia tropicalis]|nr:hypothetical protein BLOT_002586 [Blomia tropicalis]